MKTSAYLEELKSLTVADLQSQLVDAKKELFNLRFQNATNQLDNTARIKKFARILLEFRLLSPRKLALLNKSNSQKGDFGRGRKKS